MLALSLVMSFILVGLGPAVPAEAAGRLRQSPPRPIKKAGRLFNGRDLNGWYTFLQKHGKNQDPDRVITIEDGSIHLYKHAPREATW